MISEDRKDDEENHSDDWELNSGVKFPGDSIEPLI